MTHAGLVSRVFEVLKYAMLPEEEKGNNFEGWVAIHQEFLVIRSCFEILSNLSSVTIGRLEIVKVIKRSGYVALEDFYDAISRTAIPAHGDTHLIPALATLVNLLEYSRYTYLFERAEGYQDFCRLDFEHGFNQRVTALARHFLASVDRIRREELPPPPQIYRFFFVLVKFVQTLTLKFVQTLSNQNTKLNC